MSYDINDAPQTLEEYEILINHYYTADQTRYNTEVAQARTNAEAQWEAQVTTKREHMIAEMEANLAVLTTDTPDGPKPLTEAEYKKLWNEDIKKIDAQLASEYNDFIMQAESVVNQPQTMEQIEATFGFYKASILQSMEQQKDEPISQGFSYDAFYRLADNRVYSVREAEFVRAKSGQNPIDVPGGTEQDLKELLIFYRDNGYPLVKIGFELLTLEEAKIAQIKEIDAQVAANITSGFAYSIGSRKAAYYSLTETDQINFANMAICANIMVQTGDKSYIDWQSWDTPNHSPGDTPIEVKLMPEDFLALYTQGAMAHIQECLKDGRAMKHNVLTAKSKREVANMILEPTKIASIRNG